MNVEKIEHDQMVMSLKHYKDLIEKAPLYILKIDKDYKIRYANESFYTDFNYKPEQIIGLSAEEMGQPPELYKKWYAYYEKVFRNKQKEIFELKIETKAKNQYFKFHLFPEFDSDGEVSSICMYMSNISDTKLIEDERDYIFNFSLDMFAIQTINGDFLKINPSWNETLNLPVERLIGANWKDFVHEEDLVRAENVQNKLLNYDLVVSHETRFRCRDGEYLWLEWNSIPIKNKDIVISVVRNITQWKEIKDRLIDSEKRYRDVVENANYLIYSTDLKGNMMMMNNPGFELTGYTNAELEGKSLLVLVDDDYKEEVRQLYKNMIEKEETSNVFEFPIKRKNGEIRWLLQNAKLIFKNSELHRIDFIARDITLRKEAEMKLKLSETQLRNVVNSSNEVMIVVDDDGYLRDANDTAYDTLSIVENELLGKNFVNLIADEKSKMLFRAILSNKEEKNYDGSEITLATCFKKAMYFKVKCIDYNHQGNKHKLLFLTNITEIRHGQKVTQVLYNISREANLTNDLKKLYKYVHHQLETIINAKNFTVGYIDKSRQKVTFPYFCDEMDDVFESIDISDDKSLTYQVIKNRKPINLTEEQIDNIIGENQDLYGTVSKSWLGVPLLVEEKIFGVVMVQDYAVADAYDSEDEKILSSVSEILASTISKLQYQTELEFLNTELEKRVLERTIQLENTLENLNFENEERKKAQEDLQKAQIELKASLENEKEIHRIKSKFISMVSHEYRTPLTIIMSSVNLLKNYYSKMTKEQISKQYKNISSSVVSMTKLLDDVLMIGKTEEIFNLNIIEFDLTNSINSIVENIKFIDNNRHVLKLNLDDSIRINSDKKLLDHIISNVVSNAIKYSDKGKSVTINLLENDYETVKLEVIDQGIGIPEEDLDRIFESFYRSHNTGSIEGTGLGMAIVKKSIDTLGGQVFIESEVNVGTKVTLIIPKSISN